MKFSFRKKEPDDLDELLESFKDEDLQKRREIRAPHTLTAGEISGQQKSDPAKADEPVLSPLEQLKANMLKAQQKKSEPTPAGGDSLFRVRTDLFENEDDFPTTASQPPAEPSIPPAEAKKVPANAENASPEPEPIVQKETPTAFSAAPVSEAREAVSSAESENTPHRLKKDETLQLTPDYFEESSASSGPAAQDDEAAGQTETIPLSELFAAPTSPIQPPAGKTPAAPAAPAASAESAAPSDTAKTPAAPGSPSVLEKCMPFILDSNEPAPQLSKPAYTLDSVEKILGLQEKEPAEPGKPASPAESIPMGSTQVFSPVSEPSNSGHTPEVISDLEATGTFDIFDSKPAESDTAPVILPEGLIGSAAQPSLSDRLFGQESRADAPLSPAMPDADYEPPFELSSPRDVKNVRRHLKLWVRNGFFRLLATGVFLISLLFLLLPGFSARMDGQNLFLKIFSLSILTLAVAVNADVFRSFSTLKSGTDTYEAGTAACLIAAFPACLLAIFRSAESRVAYEICLGGVLLLFFRSLFRFFKARYLLSNFRQIAPKGDKNAVLLINDQPTTFAMAHTAVDGDILAAAIQKTGFLTDYMKQSIPEHPLFGKSFFYFLVSLACSAMVGIAGWVYHSSLLAGAVAFYVGLLLCNPLMTEACQILPLYCASRRCNRYGAMITGVQAAECIEQSNVLALKCSDLFPKGSVTLSDMQLLSENNIEYTIACAAAITREIDSPLYPVLAKIMETNTQVEMPAADSIKYEESLGITGWVKDSRIYIGNRALMLAHEIEVPSGESDKAFLRKGFFPVYVACNGKACARLILRYLPRAEIAKELFRVTDAGVTILVSNCDQNISEEMLCDYFDLYEDSVKIMSGSGDHLYRTATARSESSLSGGSAGKEAAGLCSVVSASVRIRRSVLLLTICQILFAVPGLIAFGYILLGSASGTVSGTLVLGYLLASAFLSLLAFLFTKP